MSFDFLFGPVEDVDAWLESMFDGAPLLVALGIAFVLGLRHASDPDHLVAVTTLVAADQADTRAATRLGAWWGIGHAGMLLAIGLPLILAKSELPAVVEAGAEKAVGIVILSLALRVMWKWAWGDYARDLHSHPHASEDRSHTRRRIHLWRGGESDHRHARVRTPQQAMAIGMLHGLAGSGAVILLLLAAMPTRVESAAALALFAPMSVLSMAACTALFAWALTRPLIEPLYRTVLIPALAVFGMTFGAWYTGIT